MKIMKRIYIYKRFERFWHWSQAFLIIFLAVTGFEVHGSYEIFGFEKAVNFHRTAAYLLLGLTAFAIFWHFTTEGWRHYIPTTRKLTAQIRFYMSGMFKGEEHPFNRTELSKLNPAQRLVYLGLKLILIPMVVISGLLYMFYGELGATFWIVGGISLRSIANWHTFGAYLMLSFLVVHVYMTTTGATPSANLRAMLTGYEEVEEHATKEESVI